MEITQEIKDFLMSRRARIAPEDAGVVWRGARRVPGLRREEVAQLAGVSTDYYTQIERGQVAGVSDEVLGAIATALRLDDDETRHLVGLVRMVRSRSNKRTRPRSAPRVPGTVRAMVDAMHTLPTLVQTTSLDVVDANPLGRALFADALDGAESTPNLAKFIFLDRRSVKFFVQWDESADDAVGMLRVAAARAPQSRRITNLVGELATRSDEFRIRWARHDVVGRIHGTKTFDHAAVGRVNLQYETLRIPSSPGIYLVGYSAAEDSADSDALQLLSSWAATLHQPEQAVEQP